MAREVRFVLICPTSPYWRTTKAGKHRGARAFRFSMLPSLYVAASMPPYVQTRIIDEDVEPIDYDIEADLVGVSFMTFNAPRAYEIGDRFRAKGIPVIFGGFHPSFLPEEAIQHADSVCIGEAESNVPKMMEDFAAGRLQPFYDGGPADLSGLPVPDRNLIRRSSYITPDVMQATRGCPYRCTFCSVAAFSRYTFRKRPVDEVVDELRGLGGNVLFMDDNIIGEPDYAKELFAAMIPLKKRWLSQCSIRLASDAELLRLASASGCCGIFIGIESLSQDNLTAWNKHVNRAKDYVRAIEQIHQAGIGVYTGVVFGMDWDTPDVFRQTLEFLDTARVDALQATILTPFPGTPLFDEMDRAGRIVDKDWGHYDFGHVVFDPVHMSPETLKTGMDWVSSQFYSRRRVARRLVRAFGYLPPSVVLRAIAPLNLGYRLRHRAFGTFERGRTFTPPTSAA
ncbi:B12-binding domain-containing radical SAM protein [Candidatus Poribacteria bacterium]|nr:B12-binding domain-containing radical SAM protein [Candidatus Poribacteria bacterium]